ncbi:MAG: dihydroorotate dehydrogenase electron transfer subunit [Planctomycetes bacterium]|nr:dihydroorotate dehydrogenase electron transfer subunit [Planctomycetota bacterium]
MAAVAERPKLLHQATLVKRVDLGHDYFELFLNCPDLAASMQAGQFVNLRVRDELLPLLRRPFSSFDYLKDARGRATGISILGHVVGQGTALMARMAEGLKVSLHGPLGKPFEPPEDPATRVLMVGGGIGIAPFLHLTRQWSSGPSKRELVMLAGGRSVKDLVFMNRFNGAGADVLLATEDGSAGVKGRVTVLLEAELKALKGKPALVLTCGPMAMMAAVSRICQAAGTPCYASLERVMGCGYGVCNGCVVEVDAPGSERGYRYAKTCVEGTVMDCASIRW